MFDTTGREVVRYQQDEFNNFDSIEDRQRFHITTVKPTLKCFDKCLANEHAVSQPDPPIARHIQVKLKQKFIYKMHQHHKLGGGPVDAWVKLLTKHASRQLPLLAHLSKSVTSPALTLAIIKSDNSWKKRKEFKFKWNHSQCTIRTKMLFHVV